MNVGDLKLLEKYCCRITLAMMDVSQNQLQSTPIVETTFGHYIDEVGVVGDLDALRIVKIVNDEGRLQFLLTSNCMSFWA